MGTQYCVVPFDTEPLHRVLTPAIRVLLAPGHPASVPAGVDPMRHLDRSSRNPHRPDYAIYTYQPPIEALAETFGGRGLTELGRCESVGAALAPPDDDLTLWDAGQGGPCQALTCPDAVRCPLHLNGTYLVDGGAFQAMLRQLVAEHCGVGSPCWIGRHMSWWRVCQWYADELGKDTWSSLEAEQVAFECLSDDPLVGLLLRLYARGALLFIEAGLGLLGWLDRTEATELVTALEPYDLRPDAPMSDVVDKWSLTEARAGMSALRDAATTIVARGHGIAIGAT